MFLTSILSAATAAAATVWRAVRPIDLIVIHCAATPAGRVVTAADIDRMHRARGFAKIGYHYFIRLDGTRETGRAESEVGAHVAGFNTRSIGICYAGGIDAKGQPLDTRTPAQHAEMRKLVAELKVRFPKARVVGHRDLSPDKNGDGVISKYEWLKACPCFDVAGWLKEAGL